MKLLARARRTLLAPAFLVGLTSLVGSGGTPAVAAETWPQAPFGTPPSFSLAYPHPLYPTGRFIPLPQLVREHKPLAARAPATADGRIEAFAALQKLAPRGDVGPPESALAYGALQGSPQAEQPQVERPQVEQPQLEQPHQERPRAAAKPRIHHPKAVSLHPATSAPVHPAKPAPVTAGKPAAPHPVKPPVSHAAKLAAPHPAKPAVSHPARPTPAHLAQHREPHRGRLPPPLNILPPAALTD